MGKSIFHLFTFTFFYEYRWRLKFLRQIVWESHGERTLPRDFCRLWSGIKALNTSLQFLVHNVFELRLRTSANRKIRISFSLTRETSNRKWGTLFSSTKGKRTLFSSTKGRRRDISVSSNKFSPTTTKGGRRQAGRQAWTDGKSSLWFCSSSQCVGPVLPVVAMVVKLLTETREEEEGEWQEKKNILSSVMVFYVWLHYENKDLVASMILKIFQ